MNHESRIASPGSIFKSQDSRFTLHVSSSKRGVMLVELLVAIAAAAIVFSLGAQLTYVSGRSAKIAADTTVALGLVSETHEAVRASATEKWQNLFNLTKNSAYHPETTAGKWVLISGVQTVTVNRVDYSRSFIAQNMCRTQTSQVFGDITGITDGPAVADGTLTTCTTSGGVYDPSTQKITVTVSWTGNTGITTSEYVFRWRNKICNQTSWQTAEPGSSTAKTCPNDTTYDTKDSGVTTGASLYLQ